MKNREVLGKHKQILRFHESETHNHLLDLTISSLQNTDKTKALKWRSSTPRTLSFSLFYYEETDVRYNSVLTSLPELFKIGLFFNAKVTVSEEVGITMDFLSFV